MCGYQGYEFGATYEDGICIDGYMWDLDSGGLDENGDSFLDSGGDIPCPKCNIKARVKYLSDEIFEMGYVSVDHPLTTKMVKNILHSLPSNARRMATKYWRAGRKQAIKEAKSMG
ncbi:hypothetical protein [Grimontia hollisae]|uniref:hypothetical protein n=1 Tax=Grimontia hollisae TaxID=673 RepID=UPI0012ACC45F|nr:hypothetical protein [Grimontia hollisae]